MSDVASAAKALFLHNAAELGADAETAEAAFMLDEEIQNFWIKQVVVVVGALG